MSILFLSKWNPRVCGVGAVHSSFAFGLDWTGGGVKCFSARAFNIFSLLCRRLIFCLRRRLNLALSPLIPDILTLLPASGLQRIVQLLKRLPGWSERDRRN